MKNTFCLFILLITLSTANAGEKETVELSLLTGVNIGWWGHNKGKTPDGNNIGWSRSHTSPKIPLEIQFWYHLPRKFSIGINADFSFFLDDYLTDSEDTRKNTKVVTFSEKEYLNIWSAKLLGRYALLRNKNFDLGPMIGLGYGNTLSTHPEQARFKKNIAYSAGFYVNWNFTDQMALLVQPNYEVLRIFPEDRKPNEEHWLSFFGVKLGVAWRI